MILSRNTVANNGPLIHGFLDSSLHRGGSKVHMTNGGMYADGGVSGPNGLANADFGQLVAEVRGVREGIGTQKTLLKAYVVATEGSDEMNQIQTIEEEASL